MNKTKVLILGNGFVGNYLYDYLYNNNNILPVLLARHIIDYHDESQLTRFILNNNIQYIVNCSGFTGRPNIDEAESKKDLCWHLNTVVALKISNVCQRLNRDFIQISSGCIYTGYDKEYTEEDTPNFGLYNESSFYSKSKHAFETLNTYGATLRIRMPFVGQLVGRNYITKIVKYDNLINYVNSKTSIYDLCRFIEHVVISKCNTHRIGKLNFVNPNPLSTERFVEILKEYNIENKNWKFVDIKDIDIRAPRSNCVLNISKLQKMFPSFELPSEELALRTLLRGTH
jgi:dTDP-4-dehydrorhamnose reductase